MANNLIVDEAAAARQARDLAAVLEDLNGVADEYLGCLDAMSSTVILSGQTAEALRAFAALAGEIKGDLQDVGELVSKFMSEYIEDMDEADSYRF